jgi:tetratricopeptide (TPR) repeat protein
MRRFALIFGIFIALALLTSAAYHLTQKADINYYKGHRLFLKGKYENSIPFYVKAIEEGSARRETYKELAYCYLWTGRSERSIELFKGLSSQSPEDMAIKGSLAEAYSWNKNYAGAINILREIIAGTNDPWANERLAEIYLWDGQSEKARIILEKLVEQYPDNYDLKVLWGKALYYTGESDKASEVFEGLLNENDG